MKIAIIGAGASGLISAYLLSKKHEVYVFERNSKPGRKLLASGNGKANISNYNMNSDFYDNKEFVNKIYEKVPPKMVYKLFEELDIFTTSDQEGRIYPYSLSSQSVLDNIMDKLTNVNFVYEYEVNKLVFKDFWFINDYPISFDHVISASGSIAGIVESKQKGIYDYLNFLKMTPLKPSLCGFKVCENIKALSGCRFKANCTLIKDDMPVYTEFGEVIFKDDGVSGIVIMNLESIYTSLKNDGKYILELDLLPELDYEQINSYSIKGVLHPKLCKLLEGYSIKDAYTYCKKFNLTIKGVYDFKDAQVVSGGVSLDMVNDNLEYVNNKTLHFQGEVLDVSGRCGGYNLHFAFATAILNWMVINGEC